MCAYGPRFRNYEVEGGAFGLLSAPGDLFARILKSRRVGFFR
jgi:hypothetical protein